MEPAYTIGGGEFNVKKFRVDGDVSIISGVPVISNSATGDAEGVTACTTTAALAMVGLSIDAASSTDAQASSGDNAGYVSCVVNPDLVMRAKFTEGATEDTALTIITQASASSAGTTVGPTTTDEFTVWGYEGANEGISRRCTAANTVELAFPYGIAAGDTFLEAGVNIAAQDHFPQLSTLLTQYNANAAADTDNDNFVVIELILNGIGDDGRNNSYALMLSANHSFCGKHTQYSTGIS